MQIVQSICRAGVRLGVAVTIGVGLAIVGCVPYGLQQAKASQKNAAASIVWQPNCTELDPSAASNQQCGTLQVPLNYKDPGGRKITVAVSRIAAADPSQRRGVLFLNPGGPGGPGLDLPSQFATLMSQDVLNQYDLIGFDPRGVGQSTPVSCGLTSEQAEQALVPLTQNNNFNDTAAFMKMVAGKCAATSGDLMPYITTNNTARDMDQIRQALGESKISYFAYSYGTYLGSVYASLFPQQSDRFVLDSNVDANWVWRKQFRSWKLADYDRFPDFAKYLAANDATYHLGTTESQINAKYFELINKLRQNPAYIPDLNTTLNDTMFREIAFSILYNDATFPLGGRIWQSADGQTPATSLDKNAIKSLRSVSPTLASVPVDNGAASALAVVCGDVAWSRSPSQYQQELASDKLLFPKFGELGSNIWPCAYWHYQPQEQPVAINANGPTNILMIQNKRDPATPYIGALETRVLFLNRARMVTVDQGGHTAAYLAANQCATNSANNYLATGAMPAHDTTCVAENLQSQTPKSQTQQQAINRLRELVR
ncbi:MAG TPA: alpha/beta hydrolase [Candidatus Saccharimonadales bacterium]|nr:alpha/beta hydrolase [Candidatus Saccharimonadales bacterium]